MNFIQKHPYLMITAVLLILCIVLKLPFGWCVLIFLAYGIVCYVTHLGTAVGWTAYLLDGFLRKPKFVGKLYKYAADHDTKCMHALVAYGFDLLKNGSYEESRATFEKIIADPKVIPLLRKYAEQNLAIACWKCGDLDKALSIMADMEAKYQYFSADFFTTFAYFYVEAGDYDKAEEYTNKALKLDESCGPAYDNFGQIAYRQGDLETAEKYFRRALDLKDTMVDSKYHLGLIYAAWENYPAAAEFFDMARKSSITGMNTVSREMVEEQFEKYKAYLTDSSDSTAAAYLSAPLEDEIADEAEALAAAQAAAARKTSDDEIETEELSELASYKEDSSDK